MDKTTLKSWFSRGKKPLASHFAALIDSFFHKDESIPMSSVEGLQNSLQTKSNINHTHTWESIREKPTTFTPSAHSHPVAEINGLVDVLNGKSGKIPMLLISNVSSVGGILTNASFSSEDVELDNLAMTYFPVRISYGIEGMYFSGLFYSSAETKQDIYMWKGNQVVTFTRSRSTPNDSYENTWNASEQDITDKQDKTDNALQTSAKTIVDAINELWNRFTDYVKGIKHITYAQLKSMRDGGTLVAGQWYRITDYVTTVANDTEARSAGHVFDILVFATSQNTLSEEAKAIKSARDTDNYFADSNLDAWKIWYSLDNDVARFAWADAENGTGVIYRMIDEWQNDCPYDFKNVQFKRYKVYPTTSIPENDGEEQILGDLDGMYIGINGYMTNLDISDENEYIWAYTCSQLNNDGSIEDRSILKGIISQNEEHYKVTKHCEKNIIKPYNALVIIDEIRYVVQALNNIVLLSGFDDNDGYPKSGELRNNVFELDCNNTTLFGFPENNHFGMECVNNIIGGYNNTFGNGCDWNTFGNSCSWNTFGNGCDWNTFGNSCWYNTFGNGCDWNTFGNYFQRNTFGNGCDWNTFGNNVRQLTIFEGVQYVSVTGIESDSSYIQNAQILNGTRGENGSNMLQISFQEDAQFCQIAGLKSDGSLRIWTPADGA